MIALADRVGMAAFLAAWAMLVTALCFAALSLRQVAGWQPLASEIGVGLPVLSCVLASAASLALLRRHPSAALGLTLAFAASQVLLFSKAEALSDPRGRHVLYLLAGFHLLHVGVGLIALLHSSLSGRPAGLWASYWHALTVAWLLIAGVLFG